MADFGMLGDYQLTSELSSQNSGFSVWGYGVKNGEEFFLKKFLSPKYPYDDKHCNPERLAKRQKQCEDFEYTKRRLYQTLNRCSDGNAVRVNEFFRVGTDYYISTQKITTPAWEIEQIAKLRFEDRVRLCASIAHSMAALHEGGLVHADLKHTNILFTHGAMGIMTTKIIDFDSSFLETAPPKVGEEIVGDQVYFSPEACLHIWGEEVPLTCKMDVFAMGVLFHQYLTGKLPEFDMEQFGSAGEAVCNGGAVTASKEIAPVWSELLQKMLAFDPQDRPYAADVYTALSGRPFVSPNEIVEVPVWNPATGGSGSTLRRGGDL